MVRGYRTVEEPTACYGMNLAAAAGRGVVTATVFNLNLKL
jgi:hypothetical protein